MRERPACQHHYQANVGSPLELSDDGGPGPYKRQTEDHSFGDEQVIAAEAVTRPVHTVAFHGVGMEKHFDSDSTFNSAATCRNSRQETYKGTPGKSLPGASPLAAHADKEIIHYTRQRGNFPISGQWAKLAKSINNNGGSSMS